MFLSRTEIMCSWTRVEVRLFVFPMYVFLQSLQGISYTPWSSSTIWSLTLRVRSRIFECVLNVVWIWCFVSIREILSVTPSTYGMTATALLSVSVSCVVVSARSAFLKARLTAGAVKPFLSRAVCRMFLSVVWLSCSVSLIDRVAKLVATD